MTIYGLQNSKSFSDTFALKVTLTICYYHVWAANYNVI